MQFMITNFVHYSKERSFNLHFNRIMFVLFTRLLIHIREQLECDILLCCDGTWCVVIKLSFMCCNGRH